VRTTGTEDPNNKQNREGNMLIVSGAYKVKPGLRDEFMKVLYDEGILKETRAENGNIGYDYYYPYESETEVFFLERWENRDCWEAHKIAPHIRKLQTIKDKYLSGFTPGIVGEI
jgi:quinol monooxygenase YgiN